MRDRCEIIRPVVSQDPGVGETQFRVGDLHLPEDGFSRFGQFGNGNETVPRGRALGNADEKPNPILKLENAGIEETFDSPARLDRGQIDGLDQWVGLKSPRKIAYGFGRSNTYNRFTTHECTV